MPKLFVTDRAGLERSVEGEQGLSLMEVIRNAGFDELLAMCGGSCTCGTCHVYLGGPKASLTAPPGDYERDLLSVLDHCNTQSRLSCQVEFTEALDGLHITIAPEA
ncbi:2Fe-2S iron-sulfur cluster-binding protein [Hydrocarboniphaga effusa]|uniref:2Fe-2S iron-sulfur cluster-binding protein n=1 Tax=Hydrocarboniphaga effusa TaxID=243629 RepID=UPI003BADAA05